MSIYEPAEDSYLLDKALEKYLNNLIGKDNNSKDIKILDMGTGFGIHALTCKKMNFKNILAADINPEAVKHLEKQKIKSIQTNLFSKIDKEDKFNIIIFNPPYLPEDKREPEDSRLITTAGERGYELIIRFLKQAKSHLNNNGKILLLFSSLSKPKIILKKARELGYKYQLLDKQKLFFEELYVYELIIVN